MVITSLENKIVKEILEIKGRGKRSKSDCLYFEGYRLVKDILKCEAKIKKLIVRESEISKYTSITEGYPTVIVDNKVFKAISSTVNSQGIGVLAHRPEVESSNPGSFSLVVDKIQDPGNLGTIIRTALAAGVDSIYLLKGTVDLYNEKTLRSTMGAIYKIPIHYDVDLDQIKGIIDKFNLTPLKSSIDGDCLYNDVPKGRYLVFVGNEGNGISEDVAQLPGIDVRIPLYGPIESLNVAVATGLILYGVKG